MDSNRKTAIIVGVLFITVLVSSMLSGVFSGSIDDPDYLTAVSANENQVLIGVLFQLTLTASVVGIPIMMFPILKKHDESLALGECAGDMRAQDIEALVGSLSDLPVTLH